MHPSTSILLSQETMSAVLARVAYRLIQRRYNHHNFYDVDGAALCYRTICIEGAQWLGTHAHPGAADRLHIENAFQLTDVQSDVIESMSRAQRLPVRYPRNAR